ncbi:hypothetical protein HOY82DRAFT_25340 [Tuber indicum]|nr:hypothetical protein HOY82DRAFT_25340 [Tuber indicum]
MPTPTPVAPPPRVPVNPDYTETMSMTQMYKQAHLAASITPSTAQGNSHSAGSPTPSGHHQSTRTPMTPQYSYSHQQHQGTPTTLHRSHSGSYPSPGSSQMSAQMLAQQQQQQLLLQQQQQQHHHQQQQLQQQHQLQQKQYNPPAPPTTFTLPDSVTSNIPTETANQFLRDAEGRLLWFTVPPLAPEKPAVEGEITGHSLAYLARKEEIEEGKRKRRLVLEEEEKARKKAREEERSKLMKAAEEAMIKALGKLAGQVASGKGEIQISGNGEGQSV